MADIQWPRNLVSKTPNSLTLPAGPRLLVESLEDKEKEFSLKILGNLLRDAAERKLWGQASLSQNLILFLFCC